MNIYTWMNEMECAWMDDEYDLPPPSRKFLDEGNDDDGLKSIIQTSKYVSSLHPNVGDVMLFILRTECTRQVLSLPPCCDLQDGVVREELFLHVVLSRSRLEEVRLVVLCWKLVL